MHLAASGRQVAPTVPRIVNSIMPNSKLALVLINVNTTMPNSIWALVLLSVNIIIIYQEIPSDTEKYHGSNAIRKRLHIH